MKLKSILLGLLSAAACLTLLSCATGETRRVDLDQEYIEDPTTVLVQDFRTVSQQMARSLIQIPQIQNSDTPPTIAFLDVENRTSIYLDKEAFMEKIRTLLLKNCAGKVQFLDRHNVASIAKERKLKEKGKVSGSAKSDNPLYGADYFLTGVIHSVTAGGGGAKTEYIRYSFRLVDADTSAIVWEDEYETKTLSQKATYDM